MDEAASKTSLEVITQTDEKDWPEVGIKEIKEVMAEWQENKV